jgi:hypothetical protein
MGMVMWKLILLVLSVSLTGRALADICLEKSGTTSYVEGACPSGTKTVGKWSLPAQQKNTNEQDSAAYFGGAGKPVSLNFQNTDIRVFLQVFTDISGKSFYPDLAVTGRANLVVNNRPWTEAFLGMLNANRLAVIKIRSGYYVFPLDMSDQVAIQRAAQMGL